MIFLEKCSNQNFTISMLNVAVVMINWLMCQVYVCIAWYFGEFIIIVYDRSLSLAIISEITHEEFNPFHTLMGRDKCSLNFKHQLWYPSLWLKLENLQTKLQIVVFHIIHTVRASSLWVWIDKHCAKKFQCLSYKKVRLFIMLQLDCDTNNHFKKEPKNVAKQ